MKPYKLNAEDENPLWRQYMDNVELDNPKFLKEIDLKIEIDGIIIPSTSFTVYDEEEFLEKIEIDNDFKEKWGQLN